MIHIASATPEFQKKMFEKHLRISNENIPLFAMGSSLRLKFMGLYNIIIKKRITSKSMNLININRKISSKKYFFLILVLMMPLLMISISCGGEPGSEKFAKEKIIYRNLLENFDLSENVHSTIYINATDPDHNSYFVEGWYAPEENIRWAKDKKSTLMFNAARTKDLKLEMECRSIKPKNSKKQKINIFLNSKPVQTIKADSFFSVYRISLPDKWIEIGKNNLTFEYELAERPSDILDTDDHRLLSSAFKYFKFLSQETEISKSPQPLLSKKDGEIIHFPGSAFIFYAKVSGEEELKAGLSRLPKNMKAHLRISSDNSPHKHLVFKKKSLKKISLKNFPNQYVKMAFYVETKGKQSVSSENFAVWSKIEISKPIKKIEPHSKLTELNNKLDSKKFDVVYIIFDAFHAKHSPLYGYHRNTTPFLKKAGEKGVVFQNFYANSPYTLASTGTFFTSRYPHEHGLVEKDTRINSKLPKLQEILLTHSISSFLITGQPWFSKGWGLSEGFTKLFYNQYQMIFLEALSSIYSGPRKDQPKFIYIHLHPPHAPYLPPKEFRIFPKPENISFLPTPQNFRKIESGEIKATDDLLDYIESMYDSNVLYADSLAQSIYDFFKQNDLLGQTILIFTSDHGDACRMQHGKLGHNTTLFQEMVHIPFVMVFPEKLNLGPSQPQIPASVLDAPSTILNLFGIPEDYGFKGKSLLPFIFSPEFKDSQVFLENFSGNRRQKGIIELPYKFIFSPKEEWLFDLQNDYLEKTNLRLERPVTAGYFQQLIRRYVSGEKLESEKMDFEKIDKKTRERLKSLGYIK
jgi:arylsulfatase